MLVYIPGWSLGDPHLRGTISYSSDSDYAQIQLRQHCRYWPDLCGVHLSSSAVNDNIMSHTCLTNALYSVNVHCLFVGIWEFHSYYLNLYSRHTHYFENVPTQVLRSTSSKKHLFFYKSCFLRNNETLLYNPDIQSPYTLLKNSLLVFFIASLWIKLSLNPFLKINLVRISSTIQYLGMQF